MSGGVITILLAVLVIVGLGSFRRLAGVGAGAGRGAPASPLLAIVLAVLVVLGAVLIFFLVRR